MMSPLGSNRKIKQFVSAVSIAQLVQIVKPHQVEEQPLIAIVVGGACNKDKGIYSSLCSSAVLSAGAHQPAVHGRDKRRRDGARK